MENFRTLNLALKFHDECQTITFANYVHKNQFERALLSISLNLAEGSGRLSAKDKRKFYSIALGSLKEVQCLLKIMNETEKIKNSAHLHNSIVKLIRNPGEFKTP